MLNKKKYINYYLFIFSVFDVYFDVIAKKLNKKIIPKKEKLEKNWNWKTTSNNYYKIFLSYLVSWFQVLYSSLSVESTKVGKIKNTAAAFMDDTTSKSKQLRNIHKNNEMEQKNKLLKR